MPRKCTKVRTGVPVASADIYLLYYAATTTTKPIFFYVATITTKLIFRLGHYLDNCFDDADGRPDLDDSNDCPRLYHDYLLIPTVT